MKFLPDRLKASIQNYQLFKPGSTLGVACSGGPDSMALLFLLNELRMPWKLKLKVFHFNHRLRGKASDQDETFVKMTAKELGMAFVLGRAQKKEKRKSFESPEEAARRMRYAFFKKSAARHRVGCIATAHTLDDQAETVLMRILQGTGPKGLCGIQRKLERDRLLYIRPVLDFTKKELADFLKEYKISFRLDKTNRSSRFVRNRIRNQLLPVLRRRFNPRVEQALSRLPQIVSEEQACLAELETKAWTRLVKYRHRNKLLFKRDSFLNSHPAIQFRVLHRALQYLDRRSGLDYEAWQVLRSGIRSPGFRHSLPRDIDLISSSSGLLLFKKFTKFK